MPEENQEYSLIVNSFANLSKVEYSLAITNKLLVEKNDEQFRTTKIGSQVWMTENLDINEFRNGEKIPFANTPIEWEQAGLMGKPVSGYFPSDNIKKIKLYNWYAVADPRGLAPIGFHIPSEIEWDELSNFVASYLTSIGENEKKVSSFLRSKYDWHKNKNGNDEFGFNATPTKFFKSDGGISNINRLNLIAYWWTLNETDKENAKVKFLSSVTDYLLELHSPKKAGFAVRCIKNKE
jgi:uncharacterized protein (TIGR02145 family)